MNQSANALDLFITKKKQIDEALTRLQTLSGDHFELRPEDIHWGHAELLEDYAHVLKQLTDKAFQEGEYAE